MNWIQRCQHPPRGAPHKFHLEGSMQPVGAGTRNATIPPIWNQKEKSCCGVLSTTCCYRWGQRATCPVETQKPWCGVSQSISSWSAASSLHRKVHSSPEAWESGKGSKCPALHLKVPSGPGCVRKSVEHRSCSWLFFFFFLSEESQGNFPFRKVIKNWSGLGKREMGEGL